MATDGTKLNQLPELTTLSDATMLYAVDGGEDYHVNFETIKDETVPEVFTPTTNGLVPHPNSGNGGKVLRGDGTWQGTFDSSNDGLVPKLGTNDKDNVLRGDGTWVANDKLIGTGSGSLVTFDAIEAPMPSLKVSVEANQDLHGYDKPWVGGAGKNKLSTNYVVSRLTSNNVDIVRNDDGSLDVTIDGTCSGTVNYLFKQTDVGSGLKAGSYKAILIADGTYTGNIQLTIGGGTSEVSYRIAPLNTTTETFTISNDDATLHYCLLQFATGATVTGKLKIYPMICSSSEDMTTWAPYSNICPISGWDNAIVTDTDDIDNPTVTQTTTISLPQTVYGGEVDVVNGTSGNKLTHGIRQGFTRGALDSSGKLYKLTPTLDDGAVWTDAANASTKIMSNMFEVLSLRDARTATTPSISQYDTGLYVGGYVGDEATLDALLSTLQIKYELATPTTLTTQPTPIKSLNGQNNLSVDSGDVIEVEYQRSITEAINALEAGGGGSITEVIMGGLDRVYGTTAANYIGTFNQWDSIDTGKSFADYDEILLIVKRQSDPVYGTAIVIDRTEVALLSHYDTVSKYYFPDGNTTGYVKYGLDYTNNKFFLENWNYACPIALIGVKY